MQLNNRQKRTYLCGELTFRERYHAAKEIAIQRHGFGTPRYKDFMQGWEDHEQKKPEAHNFGTKRKHTTA